MTEPTPYALMGGADAFRRLVHRFYDGVADDPVLRPLYPEEDLGPAEERLRMFLEQYWGGPTTYSEQRGHPRLRMRHAPFRIARSSGTPGCGTCARRWTSWGSRPSHARRCGTTWSTPRQFMVNAPDDASRGSTTRTPEGRRVAEWWRDGVVYQVYIRQLRRLRRRRRSATCPASAARLPYLRTSASTPSG